jgi:hypothetical protein
MNDIEKTSNKVCTDVSMPDATNNWVAFVDESGCKQKAMTAVKSSSDFGLAVGIVMPEKYADDFREKVKSSTGVVLSEDFHITDCVAAGADVEKIRTSIYAVINGMSDVVVVFDVINSHGFHDAEYIQPIAAKHKILSGSSNKSIRITTHNENPSSHAMMLSDVMLKVRGAVLEHSGNSVLINIDDVDEPILTEAKENLKEFDSPEHIINVSAFDIEHGKKLAGQVSSRIFGLEQIKLPQYKINICSKMDYGIFAADVIANALSRHLKQYEKKNGVASLNSAQAVADFPIFPKVRCVTDGRDATDVFYNN